MKIAIIPSSDDMLQDVYFEQEKHCGQSNILFHLSMRERMNELGHDVHTVDYYQKYEEVDLFIFDWLRWDWTFRLFRRGLLNKSIYLNAEPPTVIKYNCADGYRILRKVFPAILTWNSDWVDGKQVFLKNIPYSFVKHYGSVPFSKRKLLTAITTDKDSSYKYELYSERRKAYSFFENKYPNDFDFYGTRWDSKSHPGYRGVAENKYQTMQNYKFAICLENCSNLKDYVTEKIFDCMCSGIVPIYGGAINIDEYVPHECYIDYFQFESYNELYEYISSISEEEYSRYLAAMDNWIDTCCKEKYSVAELVDLLLYAASNKKQLSFSIVTMVYIWFQSIREKVNEHIINIKHYLKSRVVGSHHV